MTIGSSLLGGNMEHRWSDRRELRLTVDVLRQGEMLFSCESRDVGLGGTFLDLGPKQSMDPDMDVELIFHLLTGQREVKHALRARVVRVSDHGAGLRFHEFDTSVFRSLQEIMSYKGLEQVQ